MSPTHAPTGGSVARVAVRLTPDGLRQVRGGHPWVFDRSITSVRPEGRPGDLAVVFDDRRRFTAIGLLDPDSPIRVKVLHRGAPTPIDAAFWRDRLSAARSLREPLLRSGDTTAYRWVHGENDGLPALVLDRYAEVVVVKLYSAAWWPHLDDVLAAAQQVDPARSIVLRLARRVPAAGDRTDGSLLAGEPVTGPVGFVEGGLEFAADVVHGQKTGHFLDQRDNRALVRRLAAGAEVLDVFACTGGFSVNAAAGGARSVHSVDLSPGAIESARANMARNRTLPAVRACRHLTTVGDAMEVMADLATAGRRYDVVVVDPPSFAVRQAQVEGALRAYGRLAELAVRLLLPGGTLVQASCSSRVGQVEFTAAVLDAAARAGVRLDDVRSTAHALDHPVGFPQGAYLKAVIATVRPVR